MNIELSTKIIVQRELRIQGAHYGSFAQAVELLENDKINCQQFFGQTHSMQNFIQHFDDREEKKIFCSPLDVGIPCVES